MKTYSKRKHFVWQFTASLQSMNWRWGSVKGAVLLHSAWGLILRMHSFKLFPLFLNLLQAFWCHSSPKAVSSARRQNGQQAAQKEKGAREGSVPATTGFNPTEGPKALPGESSEDWNGAHCPEKSPDTGTAVEECHRLTYFVISSNDCIPEGCNLEKIHHSGVTGGPFHSMHCAIPLLRRWTRTNALPTLVILNLWSVVHGLFQQKSWFVFNSLIPSACFITYLSNYRKHSSPGACYSRNSVLPIFLHLFSVIFYCKTNISWYHSAAKLHCGTTWHNILPCC